MIKVYLLPSEIKQVLTFVDYGKKSWW